MPVQSEEYNRRSSDAKRAGAERVAGRDGIA